MTFHGGNSAGTPVFRCQWESRVAGRGEDRILQAGLLPML